MNVAYNMDCMEYMRTLPDKAFDLAVVDPPYGSASQTVHVEGERESSGAAAPTGKSSAAADLGDGLKSIISVHRTGGTWSAKYQIHIGGIFKKDIRHWDVAPSKEYFNELARVSKNQIIWGGNYFELPPTRCFLVWRKLTISESFSMAMAEYAWTSFNDNAKVYECAPQDKARFHPTQKPVSLYAWIYQRYAKPGDKILDTHLGSGSSRIAAYDAGLDFVGCEIDPDYFKAQEERFRVHTAQENLFLMAEQANG